MTAAYACLPVTFYNEVYTEPVLMMRGLVMYRDLIQHHGPGARYLLMPFYWAFPNSALKFFLPVVAVPACTGTLVYAVGKRVDGVRTGVMAVCLYSLAQPLFNGHIFWLEALNGLVAMAVFALACRNGVAQRGYIAFSIGVLFGVGIAVKLTFGAFALVAGYMLLPAWRSRALAALGATVTLALVGLANLLTNSFRDFVNFALLFNVRFDNRAANNYSSLGPVDVFGVATAVLVCLLPVVFPRSDRAPTDYRATSETNLMVCGLVSLVPLFPRFEWEHFQQVLPFVSLLVAERASRITQVPRASSWLDTFRRASGRGRISHGLATVGFVLLSIVACSRAVHTCAKLKYNHFKEVYNSRAEVEQFRSAISQTTSPSDRVYIWGSDALPAYATANRMPAARDFYQFPWMFDAGRCISDLEATYHRQQRLLLFLADQRWQNIPRLRTYIERNFDLDDFTFDGLTVATRVSTRDE